MKWERERQLEDKMEKQRDERKEARKVEGARMETYIVCLRLWHVRSVYLQANILSLA